MEWNTARNSHLTKRTCGDNIDPTKRLVSLEKGYISTIVDDTIGVAHQESKFGVRKTKGRRGKVARVLDDFVAFYRGMASCASCIRPYC